MGERVDIATMALVPLAAVWRRGGLLNAQTQYWTKRSLHLQCMARSVTRLVEFE